MLTCQNNTIVLTRGDSAVLKLTVVDGEGQPYKIADNDTVIFTIKKHTTDKEAVLKKTLSDGQIIINPQDTENLEYGQYVYDVELTQGSGFVATVIPPTRFVVAEEVTW